MVLAEDLNIVLNYIRILIRFGTILDPPKLTLGNTCSYLRMKLSLAFFQALSCFVFTH